MIDDVFLSPARRRYLFDAGCLPVAVLLAAGYSGALREASCIVSRSRGGLYILISALPSAMSGKSISVYYSSVRTAPLICLDAGGDRDGEFAISENIDMLSFRICPTGALKHFRLQQWSPEYSTPPVPLLGCRSQCREGG